MTRVTKQETDRTYIREQVTAQYGQYDVDIGLALQAAYDAGLTAGRGGDEVARRACIRGALSYLVSRTKARS